MANFLPPPAQITKSRFEKPDSGKLLQELSGGAPMAFAPDSKSIVIGTGAVKGTLDYLQIRANKYLMFFDVASGKRLPLKQIPCAGASSRGFQRRWQDACLRRSGL